MSCHFLLHGIFPTFYNKVLTISCNLLNTVLSVKNRTAVWVQTGCECIHCLPSLITWLMGAVDANATTQHPESRYHASLAQEKIKIQGWRCGFCWMLVTVTPYKSPKTLSRTVINQGPIVNTLKRIWQKQWYMYKWVHVCVSTVSGRSPLVRKPVILNSVWSWSAQWLFPRLPGLGQHPCWSRRKPRREWQSGGLECTSGSGSSPFVVQDGIALLYM